MSKIAIFEPHKRLAVRVTELERKIEELQAALAAHVEDFVQAGAIHAAAVEVRVGPMERALASHEGKLASVINFSEVVRKQIAREMRGDGGSMLDTARRVDAAGDE